jgi:1,6-anhydro-N-acetylmuramate kinase
MAEDRTRIVAGCMTGTSLDGLDVALVKIIGTGLDMQAERLGHHALPLPDELRTTLMSLASGEANEPITYMRAARALGELHADGIEAVFVGALAPQIPPDRLDFVTAHGQTIWHAPQDEAGPMSWQLFNPWPIVARLRVPVCYDLRQADLIAGGEGAPLTPIADWVMYREHGDIVANLGGVLNTTTLSSRPTEVRGRDVYPCNLLLDGLCQRLFGEPYDEDGRHAGRGRLDAACVLPIDTAICQACDENKSLGRELFPDAWFEGLLASIGDRATPEDILHTAVRLVAVQLGGEFREADRPKEKLILAGGGAKNRTLVKLIDELGYREPRLSDDLGIPCEAREAMGFAVLGALSQDGVPISLPQVTGAIDPGVAGVWAGV